MSGRLGGWALVGALALATRAHAASLYLESPPLATEAEAEAIASVAAQAGCPGDVARRYAQGVGWQHVFRSSPVRVEADLRGCADRIREVAGVEVRIVQREGTRSRVHGADVGAGRPAALGAERIVDRVIGAHGGGALDLEATTPVLFRYRRVLPDRVVEHVYARRGDDRYLRVDVVEGPGSSFEAGVAQGRAWLVSHDGALDAAHVREQLDRLAPAHVLADAATLARGTIGPSGVTWTATPDGPGAWALAVDGAPDARQIRVLVDAASWRVREVRRGTAGQATTWRYDDWRETSAGGWLPGHLAVWRGDERLDDVTVTAIEFAPTLPDAWFVAR